MTLNSKIPQGPLKDKWTTYKDKINLVNPANKRLIDIIVVGTGLAGGSASATLAELGYNVKAFCFQDSPRRAHSIAAQGGINAAKNYQGDGDLADGGEVGYGFQYSFDGANAGTNDEETSKIHTIIRPSVSPAVFELRNPNQDIYGKVI